MTSHLEPIGSANRSERPKPARPALVDKTIAISLNCARSLAKRQLFHPQLSAAASYLSNKDDADH